MGLIKVEVIELEGMAMNGLLTDARLEECSEPHGWSEIVAVTIDGKELRSGCMERDAARRNYAVIMLYIRRWGRKVSRGDHG